MFGGNGYGQANYCLRCSWLSEPVIDGVNGYLVPPRNSKLLAESMISLYEDDDFVKMAGVKSLEIIRDKYDVRKVNNFFHAGIGD